MGVWGRVGYATLSIDDRQFISGIITGMEWVAITISRREEIINCFINIFNQMDNNCFPLAITHAQTQQVAKLLYTFVYTV